MTRHRENVPLSRPHLDPSKTASSGWFMLHHHHMIHPQLESKQPGHGPGGHACHPQKPAGVARRNASPRPNPAQQALRRPCSPGEAGLKVDGFPGKMKRKETPRRPHGVSTAAAKGWSKNFGLIRRFGQPMATHNPCTQKTNRK